MEKPLREVERPSEDNTEDDRAVPSCNGARTIDFAEVVKRSERNNWGLEFHRRFGRG
ncbi:MAG: hypothetical protein V2B18_03025 [Pseudomonadota bacterium]